MELCQGGQEWARRTDVKAMKAVEVSPEVVKPLVTAEKTAEE